MQTKTAFFEDADCDDDAAEVNPGAVEVCDGIDNDCDGLVDDADDPVSGRTYWYQHLDGDGYGNADVVQAVCESPNGYVEDDSDCDDLDPAFFPGADESDCTDENDYNCDGLVGYADNDGDIDDDDTNLDASGGVALYADTDGDGYGDGANPTVACGTGAGLSENALDCDDSNAAILPEPGGGCGLGTDCLDILDAGLSVGDGVYIIDPDGFATGEAAVNAWCDMTSDGGGWTRASTIPLANPSCVFTTGVNNDPSTAPGTCSKYADLMINLIARNKIFVSRVPGYSPTFTTWADAFVWTAPPGS